MPSSSKTKFSHLGPNFAPPHLGVFALNPASASPKLTPLTYSSLWRKLVCMKSELEELIARPKRYDNIDGTGEMLVGVTLLGFALAGWLEALLPENSSTWTRVAVIYASLALAVGLAYWVRRAIKRHFTWPRTGYAAWPRHGKPWWITSILVRLIALIIAIGLALLIRHASRQHPNTMGNLNWNLRPETWNPRVVLLIIISVTAYAIWISRKGGGHWWKWLVLLLMVLGVITLAFLVPADFGHWERPPVLFVALLWLGSGAGTLYSYVRHTKPAAPEIA